jgi:hypothetical protein
MIIIKPRRIKNLGGRVCFSMKKLNIILHETTIINFPFFGRLMRRYSYFVVAIPLVVFSVTFLNYKSQNNIYQRGITLKYNAGDVDSPTSAIATLIGEKTSVMSDAQIIGSLESLDFQNKFAQELSKNGELLNLNLGSVNHKGKWDMRSVLATCLDDQSCITLRLRGLLGGKVSMVPDANIENHFELKVTTLDEKTTNVLLAMASRLVVESRVDSIRKQLSEQLKVSEALQEEKQSELSKFNLESLIERQKLVTLDLKEVTYKLNSVFSEYTRAKHRLSLMKTRYLETKKITNTSISRSTKEDVAVRAKLEKKIKNVQSDIWAVEKSTGLATAQDRAIVNQLKGDLRNAKAKLARLGRRGKRSVASDSKYVDKKTDESNDVKFDFNVMKKQYEEMESDNKILNERKDILTKELNDIELKLAKLKPSMEYLKLISSKIIQLHLLESTVISDLVFEEEFKNLRAFKKTTKNKFILFSFILTLFLMVFSIIVRYLFDDRIYDKIELEKSFEDLSIIGNTPDFD